MFERTVGSRLVVPCLVLIALTLVGCASGGGDVPVSHQELLSSCLPYKIELEAGIEGQKKVSGPSAQAPMGSDHRSGVACAHITITVDGQVADPEIVHTTDEAFGASFLEALSEWTFEPATRDGEPVEVRTMVLASYTKTVQRSMSF